MLHRIEDVRTKSTKVLLSPAFLEEECLQRRRLSQRKAWELLGQAESEGDHRGAIVGLREVRECLESLSEMLAKAGATNGPAGTGVTKVVVRFVRTSDETERDKV